MKQNNRLGDGWNAEDDSEEGFPRRQSRKDVEYEEDDQQQLERDVNAMGVGGDMHRCTSRKDVFSWPTSVPNLLNFPFHALH